MESWLIGLGWCAWSFFVQSLFISHSLGSACPYTATLGRPQEMLGFQAYPASQC
jgi:hypothetical protein